MKRCKNIKYTLISLIIAINLLIRYPMTPHEIGWDSYAIHISANSISSFGHIKWWLDPSCIFGFHPYSYASSVPLILSGISQSTSINMEWTIWIFSSIIGTFSAFTAYLMAKSIKNEDLFKILVSFVYSTSTGVLYFTTWTVSTRGLFIVLSPLYIYLLLKSRNSTKHIILLPIIFILLATTHHLFYYLVIPSLAYLIVLMNYKLNDIGIYLYSTKKSLKIVKSSVIPIFFIIMSILPPFTGFLMPRESIYTFFISQLLEYSRHIGVLIIFIFGSLIYLLAKKEKNFQEMFLLITFIGLMPFFYLEKYTKWFFVSIAALLIGIGLENAINTIYHKKKEYAPLATILLLVFSISFVGYIQFLNNLNYSDVNTRYMTEETYNTALWIKGSINKPSFSNDIPTSQRIFSVTEIPTLTGSNFNDFVYGFVNPEDINVTLERSYLSPAYYLYDPYINHNPSTSWYLSSILQAPINERNSYAQKGVKKFNLKYFIENQYTIEGSGNSIENTFVNSIDDTEQKICDSGVISVWELHLV